MKNVKARTSPLGKTIAKSDLPASYRAPSTVTATSPSPESRRSTAASLAKHALGWKGTDLETVIQTVTATRSKTRF